MKVRRNKRFHAEIAASALSDIMFFLFLFFLIISTLANPNVIKLALPKAKSTAQTHKSHMSISVKVEEGQPNQYYMNQEKVPFDQLSLRLAEHVQRTQDSTVIVRFPYDLKVQDMVNILEIGESQRLKFVIATSK
ncbi:biopolymer transporter ExbD [Flavobacterium cyanobacteriorum]|uniref:Biopolymer transporter ExbD n=1 Tax=Flavobacterium cyanobacteriorum TaxID=2022802 RepID=A0A255Z3K0_9FLAO|nr:biopolymer transporter ExbD [Flavobacterium cyanobacteriorum]OYQ35465.1 biopolymer transporter ExbD [Flavobacterium cyanobacteriorum]